MTVRCDALISDTFLKSCMYAKPLNLIGNLTALCIFIINGKINYLIALLMGVGSFSGGKLGARLVMYKDAAWLNIIFFLVMLVSTIFTFEKYYHW